MPVSCNGLTESNLRAFFSSRFNFLQASQWHDNPRDNHLQLSNPMHISIEKLIPK